VLTVVAIGHVVGGRPTPVDDDWDSVTASIRLDATRFTPAALRGSEAFSHLEGPRPRARCHRRHAGPRPRAGAARVPPRGELRQPAWASELMAGDSER
jgi:hypothetical protein